MVGLRSIWWLILGSWLISSTISRWVKRFLLVYLFSTAENTASRNLFFVIMGWMHPSSVRLLACPSCFWYFLRISTSNFGEQISTRRVGEIRPVNRSLSSVSCLIGIFCHKCTRPSWNSRGNLASSILFPAHRKQNVWSTVSLSGIRTIGCKRWHTSNLTGRFQFTLLVCISIGSDYVFWNL